MIRNALHIARVRASSEEAGFTLVELLVAISIFGVVSFAAVSFFLSGQKESARMIDRSQKTADLRTSLERVVRELRQGTSVVSSSATSLAFSTYVHTNCTGATVSSTANLCRVTYTCVSGTCTRVVSNVDGTGAGAAIRAVKGLTNSTIFTTTGTPATYVGVTFTLPSKDGMTSITVQDGAALRDATLGY